MQPFFQVKSINNKQLNPSHTIAVIMASVDAQVLALIRITKSSKNKGHHHNIKTNIAMCPSYRNVFVADGFRYLPDGSACWMLLGRVEA